MKHFPYFESTNDFYVLFIIIFCSNINKSVAFQRLVRLLVEEGYLVLSNKLMT